MSKLSNDQKEFIRMDLDVGISNSELARRFGVTEGTIRYHRKKDKEKKEDGRKTRYSAVSVYSTPIESWIHDNLSTDRKKRNTILSLYRSLVDFNKFSLSYDALRRYIRRHHPEVFKRSYFLRIETPPGKLAQIDWKEHVQVQISKPGNWMAVNFLFLMLCFSRKPVIIVREKKDQQSFLSANYEAVLRLGGITEYVRPDCMSTAVKIWNGRQSEMNADYQDFLDRIGTTGFPARPGTATDKGKVEKKIQDIFRNIDFRRLVFRDLSHVQAFIDECIQKHSTSTTCPVTGTTIAEAYTYERRFLNSTIREIPEIPLETKLTPVQKGNLVYFKGNHYQISEGYVGKVVRCIHSGTQISIHYQGELLGSFSCIPKVTGMVRMSRSAAIQADRPVSDLVRNWWVEVADRQIEYYNDITGRVS